MAAGLISLGISITFGILVLSLLQQTLRDQGMNYGSLQPLLVGSMLLSLVSYLVFHKSKAFSILDNFVKKYGVWIGIVLIAGTSIWRIIEGG